MSPVSPTLTEALRDRYLIERELGRGGMATVYLATDLKLERQVALKVLRPELTAVLGRERFLGEIRLTAKLDHPNVMTLLDSGGAGEVLYYTLPYVRGGSLRERMDKEGRLPIEDVTRIVSQIASALDHAHAQGVIHRDIKPENILLHDGVPMLTDFGIALAVSEAGGQRLTETGLVVGTPQYMSPEQATGDRLIDARSDLYSLGAVAYEMLAGEAPVLGGSAQAIIAKLITERPTPLRVVRDRIPEGIAEAVERVLAKVPADRFASGAEFIRALNAPPAAFPKLRRHATALGLGVLIVGVGVIAGEWLAERRASSPPSTPSVIAVLPARPSDSDSALSKLGRDLVLTLSANLTGAGEIRAVDPQTVLSQVGTKATRSRSQDLALARRLGAGGVVRGSLVRVGADVRWDVDLISSDDGKLLAQASTTAPVDSIRAFTDTVTRSLLRQIWMRGQAPSPSLDAAVKTRSVPALKAFLTGESEILAGRWGDGAQSYNAAITADSTFWLAYWRLWYTSTEGAEVDSNLFKVAQAHRSEMPDRERLLIEACTCLADSLPVAIRLAKQVTERFPDDWFGWLFYSAYLVNDGPILGYTAKDARNALERTLALNPRIVDAWEYLLLMSLGKDSAGTTRSLRALDSLGRIESRSQGLGFDVSLWYRLASQLQGSGGSAPHPLIDSLARALVADTVAGHGWGSNGLSRFGFPGAQTELDHLVLSSGVAPKFASRYKRSLVSNWAMRGAWDSALVAADSVVGDAPDEPAILDRYRWTVFAAWFKTVEPGAAIAAARAATRAIAGLPADAHAEEERATLAWLDGLLAVVSHDRRGLAAARALTHGSHAAIVPYLERSLRAFSFQLEGDVARMADSLQAADAGEQWDGLGGAIRTQILSVNRLTEADVFLAAGDTARAMKALVWHEAELNGDNITPQVFAPLAYLKLARIAEAQGLKTLAREDYAQFLRRYDSPVPVLQPMVEQARRAMAALSPRTGVAPLGDSIHAKGTSR